MGSSAFVYDFIRTGTCVTGKSECRFSDHYFLHSCQFRQPEKQAGSGRLFRRKELCSAPAAALSIGSRRKNSGKEEAVSEALCYNIKVQLYRFGRISCALPKQETLVGQQEKDRFAFKKTDAKPEKDRDQMMRVSFPTYIEKIIHILESVGFEAYVTGGAVRDLLRGEAPHDYDITTNARPEQTAGLMQAAGLRIVENLGQNFGVLIVLSEGIPVEIATFRGERYGVGDAHRPAEVWYCDTLREDLSRRDFTINAMALDIRGNLYDYFGGQEDIRRRLLRTVGDPKARFREDALRMYRACRFVAQLDFTYVEGADAAEDVHGGYEPALSTEENLRRAMQAAGKKVPENIKLMGPDAQVTGPSSESGFGQAGTCYELKKRYAFDLSRCRELSLERVRTELDKLLLGKAAGKGLILLLSTGLAGTRCRIREQGQEKYVAVLPELEHLPGLPQNIRFHCFNVLEHILTAVDNSPQKLLLRWASLLHDVAKGLPGVRGATPDGYPNDHGHEKASSDMARDILTRLRYPEPFVRRVSWLVAGHMRYAPLLIHKKKTLAHWIRSEANSGNFRTSAEMGEAFTQLGQVFLADMQATWAGVLREPVMEEGRRLSEEVARAARKMPVHTSDLQLDGKATGAILAAAAPGLDWDTGAALRYLLGRVQSGTAANEREVLESVLERKLRRLQTLQR